MWRRACKKGRRKGNGRQKKVPATWWEGKKESRETRKRLESVEYLWNNSGVPVPFWDSEEEIYRAEGVKVGMPESFSVCRVDSKDKNEGMQTANSVGEKQK